MPRTSKKVARGASLPSLRAGGISDEAVRKATGKGWQEWFRILDKFDVKEHGHKAAAIHLHDVHGTSGWWSQMVVVGYEQARGLRAKHEKPEGFQISRSKTIGAPVARAFKAWQDARLRTRWLDADFTVRKATPNKSLRVTWPPGRTRVEVHFYAKGTGRSQVVVQHAKLPDARAGEKMKTYWSRRLEALKETLEE